MSMMIYCYYATIRLWIRYYGAKPCDVICSMCYISGITSTKIQRPKLSQEGFNPQ